MLREKCEEFNFTVKRLLMIVSRDTRRVSQEHPAPFLSMRDTVVNAQVKYDNRAIAGIT